MNYRILHIASVFLLLFNIVCISAEPAKYGPTDAFISTGDNHFLGSSLSVDSPASIDGAFEILQKMNGVRRVYWRGLQIATWLEAQHQRPENLRYRSYWLWQQQLYREIDPDRLAVAAARKRGMEIWGVGTLFDWGSQADTPLFADYPFPVESRLRMEHPEWVPVDKHGVRKQGGSLEFAYPEARKALVDLHVRAVLKADYDGMIFLTYVENYSQRFLDEFGYSEPIVQEFRRRHKIDIRTQPFTSSASRQDWIQLRGEYVTAYLRELKAGLAKHGKKLGMFVNSQNPREPQLWSAAQSLMPSVGAHYFDIETWVREEIADTLVVYGATNPRMQQKALDDVLWLARGTKTQVDLLTSSPSAPHWEPFRQRGCAAVLAVNDDEAYMERSIIPEQPLASLRSEDAMLRLRVLGQIVAGKTAVPFSDLAPLVDDQNLFVRRLALQALGKSKDQRAVALLVKALDDPENGVRCMAALALSHARDASAARPLIQAVERNGNHMLVECAIIALRRLEPFPAHELAEIVENSPNTIARMVALRALLTFASKELLPVFATALGDADGYSRFAAAEALGNVRRSPEAAEALLSAMHHDDFVVANRAARSLGVLGARQEPELKALRPKMLTALETAFRRHGADAQLPDAEWGFRVVGNALRAFGKEGEAVLARLRDQRESLKLAELAWRVLDLHQQENTFSTVSEKENDELMKRRPLETAAPSATDLHVNPSTGSDANDGRGAPIKTIARAIRLAQPGDTIHLAPGRYHESADFSGKRGEPGLPITFEGHGAVLDGADPLKIADWQMTAPGLYRNDHLMPMNPAILMRWFFVFDGKMNRMGRCSKGASAPLKKTEELVPGEWTYVPDAAISRESKDGKPWDGVRITGAFFIKIDPEKSLADYRIEAPLRPSGVQFSSTSDHIVVSHITSTHFHNDGFNVYGGEAGFAFQNIAAIECGDDGFSAHGSATSRVDGFTSIGNSTGLCDTGMSQTHYKNVFIKDCVGYDLFFLGLTHSLENAVIESSAARALVLDGAHLGEGKACNLALKNVLLRRVSGEPQELRVNAGAHLIAARCTFLGLNVTLTPGAVIDLRQSAIGGEPRPDTLLYANTVWRGEGNRYDFKNLRAGSAVFTPKTFADFQKLTGSDGRSKWEPFTTAPDGIGADERSLQRLMPARK